MFCTRCGASIEDGTKFCSSCGNPLQQQAEFHQSNYQQYSYQHQNDQQINYGGYRAPIIARNVVTCLVLTIVTCGIYGIIWMIGLIDDLNTAAQAPGEPSGVTVLLLSIVTCGIYGIIWMYKAGEKVERIKQLSGQPAGSNTGLVYLILSLFGLGIVSYCLIQTELNNVAANG